MSAICALLFLTAYIDFVLFRESEVHSTFESLAELDACFVEWGLCTED